MRVFIYDRKIVAISQYFDDLKSFNMPAKGPEHLCRTLLEFISKNQVYPLDHCTLDIDIHDGTLENMHIIESNPWGNVSDACLFSWRDEDEDHPDCTTLEDLVELMQKNSEKYNVPFKYKTRQCCTSMLIPIINEI